MLCLVKSGEGGKKSAYFPGLPTNRSLHYQDKLTVTSKSKILAMVTSRSTSAKSRWWSCHCPQGCGERAGCAQLPCRPKRAIRHLRSPAVEVWGTKVRTTSMRILRSCCFIPLSHSWSISACPIPGKCSSSAPSVQHLACITFTVKGGCYLMSYLYLPFLPTNMTLRLAELLVQSLLSSPHQFPFHGTAAFSSSSLH